MNYFDDELPSNINEEGKKLIENAKKAIATDKSNPKEKEVIIDLVMNFLND